MRIRIKYIFPEIGTITKSVKGTWMWSGKRQYDCGDMTITRCHAGKDFATQELAEEALMKWAASVDEIEVSRKKKA